MLVHQCICYTEEGPCGCNTGSMFSPIRVPLLHQSLPESESHRCVCPAEGHAGREFGTPCACSSKIPDADIPQPPKNAGKDCLCSRDGMKEGDNAAKCPCKSARNEQSAQAAEVYPVISNLPPGSHPRSAVHCMCLIHQLDGTMKPCACNQATSFLGVIRYVSDESQIFDS